MLLLYILITFCIVYFLLHKKTNNYTLRKGILSPEFCNKLIKISEKYSFENEIDSIDEKPAYQIDIYDVTNDETPVLNKELWDIIKPIYNKYVEPLSKKPPGYVFIRRYTPTERKDLPAHLDESNFTVSFTLSERKSYEGGELYIFDDKGTKKLDFLTRRDIPENVRQNYVKNMKTKPIVDCGQGDMIFYNGRDHLHGVLPVTKGVRYSIVFFFEKPLMD